MRIKANKMTIIAYAMSTALCVTPISVYALQAAKTEASSHLNETAHRQELQTQLFHEALPTNISLYYPKQVETLYVDNELHSFWLDEDARVSLEHQLIEVALTGLYPQFSLWVAALNETKLTPLARDILLTDAALGYIAYVDEVKKQRDELLFTAAKDDADKNVTDVVEDAPPQRELAALSDKHVAHWLNAYKRDKLSEFVSSLAPANTDYPKMQWALSHLMAHSEEWPTLNDGEETRIGEMRSDLNALFDILNIHNMLSASEQKRIANKLDDNTYQGALVYGVRRFQLAHGLNPNGIISGDTLAWLNTPVERQVALLALNIQRLRFIPAQSNSGIFVNIPDYNLHYYHNGELLLNSRVVVGKASRKTPLMNSEITNVVMNPPWNVPTRLVREDIIPKAKHNPDYFKYRDMKIYSGWDAGAKEIDPSSLNWSEIDAKTFPYPLTQMPGPKNALGHFKFNMPNNQAIYLHDTPTQWMFNVFDRALSSGCIRVKKAHDLADILLKSVGWDDKAIETSLEKGETEMVRIKKRIPVSLYYQTAWVDNNQRINFRNDIYGYDQRVKVDLATLKVAHILNETLPEVVILKERQDSDFASQAINE